MSRATPQMRHFAKRLIAFETNGNTSSDTSPPAVFVVTDMLRPHLGALMGDGGFRALLARALALAKTEVPWLRAVYLKPDGSLELLKELQADLEPDEFFEGKVVLLAHLLGLLVAFIGENLTLRLVCEVWPKIPLDDLEFEHGATYGNGAIDEKTKRSNKIRTPKTPREHPRQSQDPQTADRGARAG